MKNSTPIHWIKCQLSQFIYLHNGYAFESKYYQKHGIPLVRISNLTTTHQIVFDEMICVKDKPEYQNFVIKKGDLLLAMSGATTGKLAIYDSSIKVFQNQRVGNLKISNKNVCYDKFRNYLFFSLSNTILKLAYGGAQPNISSTKLLSLSCALPPMAEQKRIVKKIEELFGVIDEQVKRLEATHAALVSYRQSILQQAFSGKLYKTSTWEEVPLKKCCLPVIKRKDSKDPSEKFLYLDIASIDNKTNKIIEGTPYRGDTAPSRARQIVQKDDVLFSTVRTYLKNIALITDSKYNNQIASTGFCVIRANQKMLLPHFIFYKTLSDAFLSPLNAKQRGSSYPAVRDGDVLSSIIDLPSLPEQKAIVKKIENAFAFADKAQAAIIGALEQAKQLKQSILKRAFEGKLVPQDPNDKPVDLTQIKKDKHK